VDATVGRRVGPGKVWRPPEPGFDREPAVAAGIDAAEALAASLSTGVKGQTPVVSVPGRRQGIGAASAVNSKGGFWFALYKGSLNGERFVELLRQMMKGRRRPLHLVLDGLPAHKTRAVRAYAESLKGKLTLHFLPG
jgi:hypothetical protein